MSLGKKLAARRNANRKMIEVAEWADEGESFFIYASELTCADVDKIQRQHKDFINNPTIAAMVDMIIRKAEDKKGDKLFTLEDKHFLMGERVDVISSIAGEMFSQTETVEEKEKN